VTYTSSSLVKAYVGASGTADDTLIGNLVTYAQKIVETYTGRVFDGTSTSTRYFDAIEDVEDRKLYFDEDVFSISTIYNRADAGAGSESIGTSSYVTIPRNYKPYYAIELLSSANKEWDYQDDPETGIRVTASWRYSETAPSDIVQATTRLAAFLYRQKDTSSDLDRPLLTDSGVTILPSQVPHDVKQMLEPYRKRFVKA
jgi:hypothetical protein